MQKLRNKKLNNDKGFSFLLVILAMSFVAILVAAIMMVSYQNFQMKHTGLKSEDNFYSAEQVLDEVKAGIQTDISEAVSDAYTYVLERYSETDGQDAARNWYFQTKYVDSLRSKFLLANSNTNQYDVTKLAGYLQKTADRGTVELAATAGAGTMASNYGTGLVLKGLKVTYTNSQGYLSVITTDLKLSIPTIDFTQTTSSPDLLKYSIVAETGILDNGVGGTIEALDGNVYAGTNGITLANGATLNIIDAERVISKDGVHVGANATFNFDGSALWTGSIDADSASKLFTKGNVFVQDDMTFNGAQAVAKLEGRYYGFSNPSLIQTSNVYNDGFIDEDTVSRSDLSSSIIINGKNMNLDLSKLQSIFIAGNSYINAKLGLTQSEENAALVQMGESISVKGNQLAYLVPENAIVLPEGVTSAGGNPIVDLPGKVNVTLDVTVKLAELGDKSLSEFGITASDCQVYYRAGTPSVTYVYMKFSSDLQAANYFNAYYKTDINKYRDIFMSSNNFKMPSNTVANITLNGSVFEEVPNTIVDDAGMRSMQTEANGYQDMYFALCKKLIPTYTTLSDEEKEGTVFTNLVNVDTLKQFLNSNGRGGKYVFTTEYGGLQAVLVDGNYDSSNPITGSTLANTRLIVATGDVVLGDNVKFNGLIVCGGKLTLGKNASITAVPDEVSIVYQCSRNTTDGTIEYSPMSFFKDGTGYILDGITSGSVSGTVGSLIDLSDIISYENWKKQ